MGEYDALVAFAKKFGQSVTQGSGIAPGFQATRASVVNSFIPWSGPFEGPLLTYPYTDVDGWVTTGTGNMIDAGAPGQQKGVNCGKGTGAPCGQATPTAKALAMPWTGGSIATDWAAIKAAWPGVQSTACKGITSARLPQDYLVTMAMDQMKANERDVLKLVPGFAEVPADGQLALHSMMWAMGSGALGTFKTLLGAVNSGDYMTAAAQSHMHGDGIDMRNLANKLLFTNAASSTDPDHLYYLEGLTGLAMTLPGGGPAVAVMNVSSSMLTKFNALPTWQKALLGVGAALVVGGAIYGVVSLIDD